MFSSWVMMLTAPPGRDKEPASTSLTGGVCWLVLFHRLYCPDEPISSSAFSAVFLLPLARAVQAPSIRAEVFGAAVDVAGTSLGHVSLLLCVWGLIENRIREGPDPDRTNDQGRGSCIPNQMELIRLHHS